LYDYRARFYDPALGRFLQPDPVVPEPGNPQALNRYAYVYNNPLRYTDPSGHVPVILVVMGIGAATGALINYGVQVQAFTHINWAAVGAGAVTGAVGVATFGVGAAVLGTSLAGMMVAGAASGVVAGQAAIVTENVLSGREITEGLGHPSDIARDAVVGAVLAGVGRSIDIALIRARYPGYYSRYISEAELQAIQETGLLRGGRPGKTFFTTDVYEIAKEATLRLSLRIPPEYRVDFEILNPASIRGPQRVRPWIRPLKPGFRAGFGVEYWSEEPIGVRILQIKRLQ